jgi:predicted phosphodiesterase
MRYAIISDIHSNLEALKACLKEIDKLKVDGIVCCGDIVGYNTNPNECIELVRERHVACVMGNHDLRASGLDEPADFNLQAAVAIHWTRKELKEDNALFLKALPNTLVVDGRFLVFHGWVNDIDRYILGARDAMENFRLIKGDRKFKGISLAFFGHTHVPISYHEADGTVFMDPDLNFRIKQGQNHLINPGGLGQPRDRDPRASFLVYDANKSAITFHRIEYDIQATAQKIVAAGLPERLAERLKLGW